MYVKERQLELKSSRSQTGAWWGISGYSGTNSNCSSKIRWGGAEKRAGGSATALPHNMTEVLQKGQKRYPGYFNTKYNFFGIFLPIFMLEIIPFENFLIIWKLTNFYYINGWFLEWFQITPKNNHLLNKNMTIFKESKSSQRACFLTWI